MKIFGQVLIALGLLFGIYAFNLNTSVTTEAKSFGSGEYSMNIPSVTVENISLLEKRRNSLLGAGAMVLIGVLLLGFGTLKEKEVSASVEPTELREKVSYSGERNLNDPNYQLFLTKRYNIERNNTLEKYVVDDVVYNSLQDALHVSDSRYSIELKLNDKSST